MTRRAFVWLVIALFMIPPIWANVRAPLILQNAIIQSPIWAWGLWVLVIASVAQAQWKVHDAKKFEGLTARQRGRLTHTANLMIARLSLFEILAIIGVSANVAARLAPVGDWQLGLASLSVWWGVTSFVISVMYVRRIGSDFRDAEDLARKIAARKESLAGTLARLRGEASHSPHEET